MDQLNDASYSRSSIHIKIQNFLFDDWWDLMERIDSTRKLLPLSRAEYERACKKYDKQYARFLLYGDEDIDDVELWAKYDAESILKDLLIDPKSLVIERVSCNGKTDKGWKCTIVYRVKNGFGGYVRDNFILIMAYDAQSARYKCVSII